MPSNHPLHPHSLTPFGSVMLGRDFKGEKYRFGFNGKEKNTELNSDNYDFGARIYDGRLGRWLSVDPLWYKYPDLGTYNFCANNPIFFIDPDGKEIVPNANFKGTNYETVNDYLIASNLAYKKMLRGFADKDNKNFILNFGTNDNVIPKGMGGVTYYSRGTITKTVNSKRQTNTVSAISTSDFVSTGSHNELTIWHLYIVVHEATHAAEVFESATWNMNYENRRQHNSYTNIREKNISVWNELNTDLNLGLTNEDIGILSFSGAEESKAFNTYLTEKSNKNCTTVEQERAIFEERIVELFNTKVSLEKNEKDNQKE